METGYRPVTAAIVGELRRIVGDRFVLHGEPERMWAYAHDEVAGEEHAHPPEVVVKPDSAAEIGAILRLANRELVPVTPRGAGSGLSGGAVPVHGGIVLSLERMNRIVEIDPANMTVTVEPGVVTNEINKAAQEHGLFYAGYPMSVESCFIGGNVAENAGGGRAIKYGVTGRYVLGLEVVLPTGEIVQLGGKRVKDVTGYDLIHLLVGSEGTLGVFTRITLRLLPLPAARAVLLAPFADATAAIAAVPQVMTRGHLVPASVEFMDRLSVKTAYDFLGESPPRPDIGAMLLLEVDGHGAEQVEREVETVAELCLAAGALDVYVGNTPETERRMWRPRQNLAEAFKVIGPVQSLEDVVVPLAQIPALLRELESLSAKYDVLIPCYGHAGDGNLHATPMKKPGTPLDEWRARLPALLAELYSAVARLGGTLSGEHGIGAKRAEYLPLVMDTATIDLQRRIKRAFDPHDILNPGKIFPPQPALAATAPPSDHHDRRSAAATLEIAPASESEREWAAQLMAGSEPWLTLGRGIESCRAVCQRPGYLLHVARQAGAPRGFILLHPRGVAGSPYVASIAVAAAARGQAIGARLLDFAEESCRPAARYIFLCVSSFNTRAQQFYERRGYETVGELADYVIDGASEILMHKRLRR